VRDLFAFISDFAREHGLAEGAAFALNVAIEELFVNMVRHNPESGGDITVDLSTDGRAVTARITDCDAEPFDPTSVGPFDPATPIEKRQPGGLGIHLARSLTDDMTHEYDGTKSTIVLTKILRTEDA